MQASRSSHDNARPLELHVDLEILRGRTRAKHRPVATPAFLIGSAGDCDLVLGDPQFPEVFAYLRKTDSGVTIRQVAPGPELTLNGEPVVLATLAQGDRLRMGGYEFQVHLRWRAAGETSPLPRQAVSGHWDCVEEQTAVLEVEALLSDIREALFPSATAPIRLYIDPESEVGEANLRAAGLPSDWNWPQRRWGG